MALQKFYRPFDSSPVRCSGGKTHLRGLTPAEVELFAKQKPRPPACRGTLRLSNRLNDAACFIDLRLRQFRETTNPGRYVDFDSAKGGKMCQLAGVVTCLGCGLSVIVSAFDGEGLRCMRCRGVVGW